MCAIVIDLNRWFCDNAEVFACIILYVFDNWFRLYDLNFVVSTQRKMLCTNCVNLMDIIS